MEIVQERLEREYDLDLIVTAPSVIYKVNMIDGSEVMVDNPATLPDPQKRESIEEPYVRMEIYAPNDYNGALMGLCQERRGDYIDMKYITTDRVTLIYELPLAEVVTDFFDQMKTRTQGYASMEYSLIGYRKNQLVRLDVLINGERADALTTIVHQDKAYNVGKALVEKLKELIPASSSRFRFRRRLAVVLLPPPALVPSAKTCWPSATAVISPGRRNC